MAFEKRVNRRGFLTVAAGGGAAAILAACGNTAPAAPAVGGGGSGSGGSSGSTASTPAKGGATTAAGGVATAPVGGTSATSAPARRSGAAGGAVYILQDKSASDAGSLDATTLYNTANKGASAIALEDEATGWEAKVLPQIKDKSLRWSGSGYIPYFDQYKEIKAGIVAPLDDYLKASKVPWAAKQKDVYFTPRIFDALQLDGKQYYIPMRIHPHMVGWRVDHLQAAGYDTMPKTWDEVDKMLPKIKTALAKDQVTPFSIARDLWRSIGVGATTFQAEPLDEQGVFKLESAEWITMIEMYKKWIDGGLARFDTQEDAINLWQKGKFSMSLGSQSWVRLGRQVFSADKVKGGTPPQASATMPPRTWCHIDSACVFVNAPNGQAATDWALTTYGPEGAPAETWWKGTLQVSGAPLYQPMIDKFVKTNQDIIEINEALSLLPNSHINTVAQAAGFGVMQLVLPAYLDRYFKGEFSSKDAMAKARAEINAEFAKQKA